MEIATHIAVGSEVRSQRLRVTDDRIARRAIGKSSHICIVAVGQNAGTKWCKYIWQQIDRPETAGLAGPGILGMAVETVNKHDIDRGVSAGSIDLRQAKLLDRTRGRHYIEEC